MATPPTLFFLCGKMAAGKSTLSRQLSQRAGAVLLEQDHFLATLFPGEIVDIPAFVDRYDGSRGPARRSSTPSRPCSRRPPTTRGSP